jgi:hypothetical protein
MRAPTADSGEQLSPIQRRQQVAAILALGVLRYCRIARLTRKFWGGELWYTLVRLWSHSDWEPKLVVPQDYLATTKHLEKGDESTRRLFA